MRRDRIRLVAAFAITALGVSGVSLLAPVLPELSVRYGVAPGAMSLFQTAVMAPGILVAVLTRRIASARGLRGVLRVLLVVYGLAGLALILVSDFPTALVLRLVQGIGGGGLVTLSFMLISTVDTRRRMRATGHNAAVISTMMVLQPMLGSVLGRLNPAAPFAFYGLALVAAFVVPRAVPLDAQHNGSERRGSGGVPIPIRGALVMNVLLNVVFFGWLLLLTPFLLEAAGIDLSLRGWALALQSAVATVVTLLTARWRERGQYRALLVVGWGTLAVILAGAAVGPSGLAAALLVLAGVVYGAVNPTLVSVISSVDRGRWLGWWQSSSRMGQVIGPLVAGALFASLSSSTVLAVGAAIGLGGIVLALVTFGRRLGSMR